MANNNRVDIELGIKTSRTAFRKTQVMLGRLSRKLREMSANLSRMGSKAIAFGKNLTRSLTLPIGLAGGAILKVAGDFQSAMNILEAKTGATKDELIGLRGEAQRLGKITQFTASQVAEGMIELAKAGLKPKQIMDSIGASLDFAVASGLSLAEVSAAMADTFGQFSLSSTRARDVADLFTKSSDSATTNVLELAEAMSKAGASSNVVGNSMEDTFAVLTALANVGQKASISGTALSNAFVFLGKRGKSTVDTLTKLGINIDDIVDKNGRLKVAFSDVLIQLGKSNASLVDMINIFDVRAGRTLAGAVKNFGKVEEAVRNIGQAAGNAEKQSKTVMKGFNGAVKELISALEALAIAIADSGILDFVTKILKKITGLIRAMSTLDPRILAIGSAIAGALAIIGPMTIAIGGLIKVMAMLGIVAAASWAAMLGPIAIVLGTIAVLAGALYLLYDDFKAFKEGRVSVMGWILKKSREFGTEIGTKYRKEIQSFVRSISDAWDYAKDAANTVFDYIDDRINRMFDLFVSGFEYVKNSLTLTYDFGKALISNVLGSFGFDFMGTPSNAIGAGTPRIYGTGNSSTSNSASTTVSPTINVTVGQTGSNIYADAYNLGADIGMKVKDILADLFGDANEKLKPSTEQ